MVWAAPALAIAIVFSALPSWHGPLRCRVHGLRRHVKHEYKAERSCRRCYMIQCAPGPHLLPFDVNLVTERGHRAICRDRKSPARRTYAAFMESVPTESGGSS